MTFRTHSKVITSIDRLKANKVLTEQIKHGPETKIHKNIRLCTKYKIEL
jgi:hypothetical protein